MFARILFKNSPTFSNFEEKRENAFFVVLTFSLAVVFIPSKRTDVSSIMLDVNIYVFSERVSVSFSVLLAMSSTMSV